MFKIKNRIISKNHKPFIIAEMSSNHNQSLNTALKIVDIAAKTGVDAIKIQTYTADTITMNSKRKEFTIKSRKSLWNNSTLYDLYKKAHTPWEWHKAIFQRAKKNKILCFSSPFDNTSVDFLEKIGAPCYKIASPECVDLQLIKKVALTGKPMIISTGMATKLEISDAIETAKKNGCKNLALLKCTSTYPAPEEDINLRTIQDMKKEFKCEVGLSDHTLGISVPLAAMSLGATIIEKHFVLSKKKKTPDSAFSSDPSEFSQLVIEAKKVLKSIGKVKYGPTKSELTSLKFRRSLYVVRDIKKGELITKNNIRSIRPSNGMAVNHYEDVLGFVAKKNLKFGTPLSWDLVKKK